MTSEKFTFKRRIWFWIILLSFFATVMWIQSEKLADRNASLSSPKTAYDFYQSGKIARNSRDYEKAEKAFLKALALDAQLGNAEIEMGALYHDLYLNEESIRHSMRALDLLKGKDRVNEEIAYYNLGAAYQELNDCQASFENFRKAYEMKSWLGDKFWPDNPQKFVYYVMKNDRETYCQKISNQEPGVLPFAIGKWQEHFVRLLENRNYDRIISEGKYFLHKHPEGQYNFVIHKYLVSAYFYKKQYGLMLQHVKHLEDADLKSEDRAWLIDVTAYYYLNIKDYKNALQKLDTVIRDFPQYRDIERVYIDKVFVHRRLKDVDGEKKTLLKILDEFPGGRTQNFAKNRLYSISLLKGEYEESYRFTPYHQQFGKMLLAGILMTLVTSFLPVAFLFIVMCVFFSKRREEVRNSPFRLRHLFMFVALDAALWPVFIWGILEYNHNIAPVFSAFAISPILISVLLSSGVVVWYLFYLMRKIYGMDLKSLGFQWSGPVRDIFWPILILLFLMGIESGYLVLLEHLKVELPQREIAEMFRIVLSSGRLPNMILMCLGTVVVLPVAEEIIYRVFMIRFVQKYTSLWFAVLYSSVAFAISHQSMVMFPTYFIVGLVLSLVYLRTGSIVPCISVHILNNLVSFGASLFPVLVPIN